MKSARLLEKPVMWYGNYDFEKRRPDMIYIHNPYDKYNYVTSVHPDFYSENLKRYTDVPELTRELCLELIEYITIGASPDDKTGAREIHIYYKLLGKET